MFSIKVVDIGHGDAVVHVDVQKWSHNVRRMIDEAIDDVIPVLISKGIETVYAIGALHPRFCEYMGGEFVLTHTVDGEEYEVFKWELVQPES